MRDGLASLLDMAGFRVSTFGTAIEFIERGAHGPPGCVISDVRMPGMTGLELLKRLHDRRDDFPMILLTGAADVPMAVEALKDGALDFIEKPFEASRIVNAAREALHGLVEHVERDASRNEATKRLSKLSARERDVLREIVAGASSKIVARKLGISPRTVETYRANIMAKVQAESLAELVRIVLVAGGPPD
jgi:two-component system response regulator FixJ